MVINVREEREPGIVGRRKVSPVREGVTQKWHLGERGSGDHPETDEPLGVTLRPYPSWNRLG